MDLKHYKKPFNVFDKDKYKGYFQSEDLEFDKVISEIGPGTSCGEFLRRYWHPIALSSEISEQPKLLRVLGEDLILFKTPKNELGLVHKKEPLSNLLQMHAKVHFAHLY